MNNVFLLLFILIDVERKKLNIKNPKKYHKIPKNLLKNENPENPQKTPLNPKIPGE